MAAHCSNPVNTQALYRLYDADRRLLYIGVSKSALGRLAQHLNTQPWADQVAEVRIERHNVSRTQIEDMERRAIIAERPIHNKAHNTPDRSFVAHDTFDHHWIHHYASDIGDTCIAAVDASFAAFADYKAPGDHPSDVRQFWSELVSAALNYTDVHRCQQTMQSAWLPPYRRDADGWCRYKCSECGEHWTCWYR